MAKDYAHKSKASRKAGASRKKHKATVPLALWLFTAFLLLALVSGLSYLKWFTPKASQSAPNKTTTSKTQNQSSKKSTIADEIPSYNIYDDLTNKKVEIPEEDLTLPNNSNKYYYLMSCGSFRAASRADELKAQIAMTGNNSIIKPVQYKGETWYRVELGPFSYKRAAESIRHRLQDNSIHNCIINRHLKK